MFTYDPWCDVGDVQLPFGVPVTKNTTSEGRSTRCFSAQCSSFMKINFLGGWGWGGGVGAATHTHHKCKHSRDGGNKTSFSPKIQPHGLILKTKTIFIWQSDNPQGSKYPTKHISRLMCIQLSRLVATEKIPQAGLIWGFSAWSRRSHMALMELEACLRNLCYSTSLL